LKKGTIKFLKIAVPLLFGIFLIGYSYTKFTPEQLVEIKLHFSKANYWYVALAVLCGILSNLSRAYRWNYMLGAMGYRPAFKNNIMAVYIAYLMNLFIPRSGEVSRALVLNKYERVPFEKGFGTIISERVADSLILLTLILITFGLQFQKLSEYLQEVISFSGVYFLLVLFIVGILAIGILHFQRKTRLAQKIFSFLKGVKEGVWSIIKMKQKWPFIFHTIFIWTMYFVMFYIVIFALPETASISLTAALTGFVVGGLVIAFTNGGFGSYPVALAGILLLFNVPETAGTAFGWIVWTSQTITTMIFGVLSFLMLPVLNKS